MHKRLLLFLWVCLQTALASAQGQVQAELYSRVEGRTVEAALRLEIAPGWHLYHRELGHPDAIGKPTTVVLGGQGIEWGEVRWPEPHRLPQTDFGPDVYVLAHEGTIVLRASGTLAPGATGDDVSAEVSGLVCKEQCVPYRATVHTLGPGSDALFAPSADLIDVAMAPSPTGSAATTKVPSEDVIARGEADTTLYTRTAGDTVTAALVVRMKPGWHLYHDDLSDAHPDAAGTGKPTRVTLYGEGVRWGPVHFPAPHRLGQGWEDDQGNEVWLPGHEGEIVLWAEGHTTPGVDPGPIHGEIHGQTCESVCVDYDETFVSAGPGDDALFQAVDEMKTAGDGAGAGSRGTPTADGAEKSLLAFLLAAIGGGLFALLMPCTYPMVPITISFFTKQADARGGKVLPLALAYGAGIILIFIAIGVVVGPVIIRFATHPVTNLVIGALFFVFALALFGVVNLEPPRSVMNIASKASSRGGYLGVFLMGAALVVTSFTCTAPVVGSLLGLGGVDGDLPRLVLGMAVFGATMAIPFVFLSLVPGRLKALPRSGEWMNTLKHFLGFVELAAALKFFSNADLVWGWNTISREFFLGAWALLFLLAGLYLFGLFRRKATRTRIGRMQFGGGLLSIGFAVFCLYGMRGAELGYTMTAIAPAYSGGRFFPEWYTPQDQWKIVEDDYERATTLAKADDKLLLVNFTGHT